jgi:hypothetical protein
MEDNGRTVMTPAEYESYYEENLEPFMKWYGTESQSFETRSRTLQWRAAFCGALATIFAAIPTRFFELLPASLVLVGESAAKFAVVIAAASTTFLMSILARHGVEDGYRMRESGRAEVNNVAQKAKLRLMNIPMTPADRVAYQEYVADEIEKIEKKYGGPPKVGR